jgi:hypothetical protein
MLRGAPASCAVFGWRRYLYDGYETLTRRIAPFGDEATVERIN